MYLKGQCNIMSEVFTEISPTKPSSPNCYFTYSNHLYCYFIMVCVILLLSCPSFLGFFIVFVTYYCYRYHWYYDILSIIIIVIPKGHVECCTGRKICSFEYPFEHSHSNQWSSRQQVPFIDKVNRGHNKIQPRIVITTFTDIFGTYCRLL